MFRTKHFVPAYQRRFNPISSTLLKKALQSLLSRAQPDAFGSQKAEKEMIDKVIQSANGDIRSAIMALEFICGGGQPSHAVGVSKKKRLKRTKKERSLLVASCRKVILFLMSISFTGLRWSLSEKTHSRSSTYWEKSYITKVIHPVNFFSSADFALGKGDPSSSSASAKEIQKEKEAEALMPDPPPLPSWLDHEFRRPSKVNPEVSRSGLPQCNH